MEIRQEPAAPQRLQRGMAEVRRGEARLHRHPDGAMPEHGALARREYGLLVPEKPVGDTASAKPQVIRDSPEDTSETGHSDKRETGTG